MRLENGTLFQLGQKISFTYEDDENNETHYYYAYQDDYCIVINTNEIFEPINKPPSFLHLVKIVSGECAGQYAMLHESEIDENNIINIEEVITFWEEYGG